MINSPLFFLRGIFETKTFPHARTLRTSFSQKFSDAFLTLIGLAQDDKRFHVGIFDYLTLFIPAGLIKLGIFLDKAAESSQNSILMHELLMPLAVINICTTVVKIAFGIITAMLFLPIIALVHAISRSVASPALKEALALEGQDASSSTTTYKTIFSSIESKPRKRKN